VKRLSIKTVCVHDWRLFWTGMFPFKKVAGWECARCGEFREIADTRFETWVWTEPKEKGATDANS
jgi:hypothetical protein